eukprot:TRINITY_DN2406_c0_g2_i1.p1 TRINITY_DN2406_c0_g2~~TRINITY_DN2406_c0_g2_i1.p1  ORF type:complete len:108 (+),score=39.27 TRINITY_DN2406_c0_g2_i1:106-429(+)
MPNVIHIKNGEEYDAQIKRQDGKLVVVDFFATWCGPCKRISPWIEKKSDELTDVVFLKVDVDEVEEVGQKEGITAMPTFFLYKNGSKVADLVGASEAKLLKLIEAHK